MQHITYNTDYIDTQDLADPQEFLTQIGMPSQILFPTLSTYITVYIGRQEMDYSLHQASSEPVISCKVLCHYPNLRT